MNKEYFSIEGKCIITDEYGNITERKESKNIKKILEKENTIELLKKEIEYNKSNSRKDKLELKKLGLITLIILLTAGALHTSSILPSIGILSISTISLTTIATIGVLAINKIKDIINRKINIKELNKEVFIQKEKIKYLQENDELTNTKFNEKEKPVNHVIGGQKEYADAILSIKTRKKTK